MQAIGNIAEKAGRTYQQIFPCSGSSMARKWIRLTMAQLDQAATAAQTYSMALQIY